MPIKSKQKASTHFLVYPPDKELLPFLAGRTFPESSLCIDPDVRQTAHSFLPDRLSDCKARLWVVSESREDNNKSVSSRPCDRW